MLNHVKDLIIKIRWSPVFATVVSAVIVCLPLTAAILPEDRADALYHRYEGGGVTIDGPSILARKSAGSSWSFFGNYYVDFVSSASIDVETYASPYTEERREFSLGTDYLHDKTTLSLSYTNSEESDYSAESLSFNISHDMFGDLTTVNLGFTRGWDEVRRNDRDNGEIVDSIYVGDVDRWRYRLGLSQILTKDFVMGLSYELITDEGTAVEGGNSPLANPYRQAAVISQDAPGTPILERQVRFFAEQYPGTRTSNALGIRAKYFLPWRAAVSAEYRTYSDSWDIKANMFDIGIAQPIKKHWIIDFHYRAYSQTAASFFSNLFYEPKIYMGRDKELSTFTSTTIGGTIAYEFLDKPWWIFDKGSVNLSYDKIFFEYEDFLDVRDPDNNNQAFNTVGEFVAAPTYSFDADVIRFYISAWY